MVARYRSYFSQILQGRWSYNHTPACGSPSLCQLCVSFPLIGEGRYHCIVTTWPLSHTDLANAGNHMGEKFKFLSKSVKKNLQSPTVINIFEYFKVMKWSKKKKKDCLLSFFQIGFRQSLYIVGFIWAVFLPKRPLVIWVHHLLWRFGLGT